MLLIDRWSQRLTLSTLYSGELKTIDHKEYRILSLAKVQTGKIFSSSLITSLNFRSKTTALDLNFICRLIISEGFDRLNRILNSSWDTLVFQVLFWSICITSPSATTVKAGSVNSVISCRSSPCFTQYPSIQMF